MSGSADAGEQSSLDDLPPEPPSDIPSHAQYIGTDGEGVDHFWSIYEQTDYLVDGDAGEIEVFALEDQPCPSLGTWCVHIRNKRGPWDELRVDVEPSTVERYIAEREMERDAR